MCRIVLLIVSVLFLSIQHADAQIGAGLLLGGNVSKGDGPYYRSQHKLGLQVGGYLNFPITNRLSIQPEPQFSIARVRTLDAGADIGNSIEHGNKSLQYFSVPVLLKFELIPQLSVFAGAEYNKLLNGNSYTMRNRGDAFRDGSKIGYTLGFEISRFYFRYRHIGDIDHLSSHHSDLHQYQLGVKWRLF